MTGNQNLPNKQVTSNNMTSKPLLFPYRSRSNRRDNRDTSLHRNPNKSSFSNSKPSNGKSNFEPLSRSGSPFSWQNQPFTFTKIQGDTITSLEASPTDNIDTIVHSRPMDANLDETTEFNFSSTLFNDATHSHLMQ